MNTHGEQAHQKSQEVKKSLIKERAKRGQGKPRELLFTTSIEGREIELFLYDPVLINGRRMLLSKNLFELLKLESEIAKLKGYKKSIESMAHYFNVSLPSNEKTIALLKYLSEYEMGDERFGGFGEENKGDENKGVEESDKGNL